MSGSQANELYNEGSTHNDAAAPEDRTERERPGRGYIIWYNPNGVGSSPDDEELRGMQPPGFTLLDDEDLGTLQLQLGSASEQLLRSTDHGPYPFHNLLIKTVRVSRRRAVWLMITAGEGSAA